MIDEITIGSIYNGRAHNMRVKILTKAMMNRREKNKNIMNGKVYHLHGIFIFVCVFFSAKQPSCLKK